MKIHKNKKTTSKEEISYVKIKGTFPTERLNVTRFYKNGPSGLSSSLAYGSPFGLNDSVLCEILSEPCFSTSDFETSRTKERQISCFSSFIYFDSWPWLRNLRRRRRVTDKSEPSDNLLHLSGKTSPPTSTPEVRQPVDRQLVLYHFTNRFTSLSGQVETLLPNSWIPNP